MVEQWFPEGWTVGDKVVSGGLLTVVVTLGFRALRMLLSGDRVKLTKDRAEEGLVTDLRRERDEARQGERMAFQRADDAVDRERLALAREAECLRMQERMSSDIRHMGEKMESMTQELARTRTALERALGHDNKEG